MTKTRREEDEHQRGDAEPNPPDGRLPFDEEEQHRAQHGQPDDERKQGQIGHEKHLRILRLRSQVTRDVGDHRERTDDHDQRVILHDTRL